MDNIRLNIVTGSSSMIYVRTAFDDLFPLLESEREIVVIIDRNVEKIYGEIFNFKKIVIDVSEEKKCLETVDNIIGRLLSLEASRNCLLVGVGGGITTDIVGLVSSIYKRGVRCAYVSTTLLSQVDASFGGKTGVNYAGYKNVVGSFSQPIFSYINISSLKTLPHREFISGLTEMIKMFAIADRSSYRACIDFFKNKNDYSLIYEHEEDVEAFKSFISKAIRLKCWIVEKDEKETGERRLLNFGHTFGHAIEKMTIDKSKMLHGEAVSIGMVYAAEISQQLGFLADSELDMLRIDLQSIGLPVRSDIMMDSLIGAINNDKKREGDSINFVVIKNIGSAMIKSISMEELEEYSNALY